MPSNYPAKKAYRAPGSLTPERQQKFFDALAKGISLAAAARAAGVSHSTVYELRKRDPKFAQQIEVSREAGSDMMEDALLQMGVRDKQFTPLIFLLKGRRPHIYRENLAVTGGDGGPVQYESIERHIIDPATVVATQHPKKVNGGGNGASSDGTETSD